MGISVGLWRTSSAERAGAGESGVRESTRNVTDAPQPGAGFRAPGPADGDGSQGICDAPQGIDPLAQDHFIARMEVLLTRIPTAISGMPEERVLLLDPEYRKARLTQMRIVESLDNPELASALGISDAEATRMFEVMAESQLTAITQLTMSRETLSGAALAEAGTKQL